MVRLARVGGVKWAFALGGARAEGRRGYSVWTCPPRARGASCLSAIVCTASGHDSVDLLLIWRNACGDGHSRSGWPAPERGRGEKLRAGGARRAADARRRALRGAPATLPVRLDVSRMLGNGYALRLRFHATLVGPCMRCLKDAAPQIDVDAREVDRPGGGEELSSPYLEDETLDLAGWARDALCLALPDAGAVSRGLRRAVPGVRRRSERGRPRAHARAPARPALGEAERAEARIVPGCG